MTATAAGGMHPTSYLLDTGGHLFYVSNDNVVVYSIPQ